jgi:predicted enzyme related to lactoylglutathione lyase
MCHPKRQRNSYHKQQLPLFDVTITPRLAIESTPKSNLHIICIPEEEARLREASEPRQASNMEAATTTTRPQPKLHTLVHFEIPASDPASVSKFYEQLFGWKFSKWGEQDYWLIAHKDAPANETMGGLFKRNTPNEQFLNYISVNSIDESAAKATGLGAQVVTAKQEIPTVGYFAVLKDPDGNVFALFQSTGGM